MELTPALAKTSEVVNNGGEKNLLNLCMSVTESLIAHHTRVFSGSADAITHLLLEDIFRFETLPFLIV